jgi:non-ribosomal peptide synthase protein (TIGR01720 family)
LRRHFQSPANLADLHYWQQTLDTDFHLPREGQPRLWRLADCATQVHALEPDASQDLPRAAREKYGVEPGTLVLAALAGALRQWSGQATVLIETEGHGRHLDDLGDAPDPARGLGWYTAMYPLALRLDGSDPAAWVGQVRAQAARTPNQGLGFGVLRHLLRRPELEHAPQLPPVRFNYLGEIDRMLSNDLFVYRPADSGPDIAPANRMTCELEIVAMIHEGRLRLRLTHHRQAQAADSIGRLAEATCAHLRAMLAATAQAAAAKPTPGDFDTAGLSAADLEELF